MINDDDDDVDRSNNLGRMACLCTMYVRRAYVNVLFSSNATARWAAGCDCHCQVRKNIEIHFGDYNVQLKYAPLPAAIVAIVR